MPVRQFDLSEWFGRIILGGAVGCSVLFVIDMAICLPIPMYKGDPRWKWVELTAELGLPVSFVVGALAGLIWRRSRFVRLTPAELIVCSLIVALIAIQAEPAFARVRGTESPLPMYELVPRVMTIIFGTLALAGLLWLATSHGSRWLRSRLRGADVDRSAAKLRDGQQ
jgi:hypothetical protein